MDKVTHSHLVIIGIYVCRYYLGFGLLFGSGVVFLSGPVSFNLLPVFSSRKFQCEYRRSMSNPYVNNQYKRGIHSHYPIAFFYFRNNLLFNFKLSNQFDGDQSWRKEVCFVVLITLPALTAQLISGGRPLLEYS